MKITRNYKPEPKLLNRDELMIGSTYLMVQNADGSILQKDRQCLFVIAATPDTGEPAFVNLTSDYSAKLSAISLSCRFLAVTVEIKVME